MSEITTKNSLSSFLEQLLRVQSNAMVILGKLTEVTGSNSPSIIIQQEDSSGVTKSYEVPGIGYVKSEIERLDTNFKSLIGQDGNPVTVRMPDGSYKKIMESSLFREPSKIGQLSVPSSFNKKNNWFFESFLNPLLYISFDITKYVPYDTQEISYKRIIVNTDTDEKKLYFDSNFKGKNDLDYSTFLTTLYDKKITYFIDEDKISLPVSVPRYSGSFDVISAKDETVTTIQTSGATASSKIRRYKLNTLSYTDNLQTVKNTLVLKPGNKLSVGTSTVYEVLSSDSATNTIVLKRTSGAESISIGTDILKISIEAFSLKEAQINIGFDEREVIFVKAIDKVTNMTTGDFSPGVGFYTNELIISTPAGNITLDKFYKEEVMDFGSSLLMLSKEGAIPAIYGETPDAPKLNETNFKVSLVNSQKIDTNSINNLKKKISQKNSTASEIDQLSVSIEKVKKELNTSKFTSDAERKTVQDKMDSLIREKISKSNLYASIIKELSTSAKNLPSELSNPKYAIKGFFPIPLSKVSSKTLDQNVIQFIISYRYLRLDGTSPGTEQLDFIDNNGSTVRGYVSNWIETITKTRQKKYDETLGIYVWINEDVQNADDVNVNQINIPITKGEKVEIKIKSVSEAGWPTNPMKSDWSESITISFPDNLSNDEEVLASLSEALSEETRVNFNQDLSSRGLDTHLSNSFVQKDKYFSHTSDTISSGFYNTDGTALDLFQKLNDLDFQISTLKGIIEKAKGKLTVSIIDTTGAKYPVSNNSTINLFAGYYNDIVNTLPSSERKGAIITSVFKLFIENTAASTLQLVSKFPGGFDVGLENSSTTTDSDYARRAYDTVPISLSSMLNSNSSNLGNYQISPFQSIQKLSQFIYIRSTDIGLVNKLVSSLTGPNGNIQNNTLYPQTGGTASTFIWDYTYTGATPTGNGGGNSFCIHTSHPDINTGSTYSLSELNQPSGASSNSPSVLPKFVQSSFFNLQSSDANGKLQLQYLETSNDTTYEMYPSKLGFYTNDRYLIGENTCGSYFYISPSSYSDILVDGVDYRALRKIEFGTENGITIPLIFQFRMTDFWGSGVNGTGRIGGLTTNVTNLSYTKKLGIDLFPKDESTFSFDVQVSAKYKIDSPSQTAFFPSGNTNLISSQAELVTKIF